MSISRYTKNPLTVTSIYEHEELLSKRGVQMISHLSFTRFKELKMKDLNGVEVVIHTWTSSDRFYKLAGEYYKNPTYWWVIAFYNGIPLESDVGLGTVIEIPVPIENILRALEY